MRSAGGSPLVWIEKLFGSPAFLYDRLKYEWPGRVETQELWQGRLPVPGVANPMTYLWKGEQYVAIVAGGHSEAGTTIGDSVVAFRLARPGEAPSLWSRTIDRPGGRFFGKAVVLALAMVVLAVALWRRRRRVSLRRAGVSGVGR